MNKTACIITHRDLASSVSEKIKPELKTVIARAVNRGITVFRLQLLNEADLAAAKLVLELKRLHPSISLEIYMAYTGLLSRLGKEQEGIIKASDTLCIISPAYTPNSYMLCVRAMLRDSGELICVYDGRAGGNAVFALRYAAMMEMRAVVINTESAYCDAYCLSILNTNMVISS